MKRFVVIGSIFLFLSFSMNEVNVFAEPESKTLTQGFYNARDTNLLIGTPLTTRITPANSKAIILVIDSNQTIQALVRLNAKSTQQTLPPLDYDYSIIILGNGSVTFS